MIYSDFKGLKLSKLGFGTMRLPVSDGEIDEKKVEEMFDCAIKNGVNYFDTAWPYHGGKSENVTGKILSKYPRDSFYLADKYPGHQIRDTYDPADIFEKQLEKCSVDYFDFYLLHNVCENSYGVYNDPKWGIIDYFKEQVKNGRIRHLGFSSHARPETLRDFLEKYGDDMEFCQIQYNYVDETLQDAKEKCEILKEFGIPIWVMEPLRGGKLASLPEAFSAKLSDMRPDESVSSWAFRWLTAKEGVTVVLSGMSEPEQLYDNIKTFSEDKPLSAEEMQILDEVGKALHTTVPCTACRYCTEGCPMGLDIPVLISAYNDAKFQSAFTVPMLLESLPEDKLPTACLGCGACEAICPQGIKISEIMSEFGNIMPTLKSWKKICLERAAAEKELEGKS